MSDIEEHLGITINCVREDLIVPIDEFDGKVVYGGKRSNESMNLLVIYKKTIMLMMIKFLGQKHNGHAIELTGAVKTLNDMERIAQLSYLSMFTEN